VNFLESLKVALSSIWGNKMRSFLTMLGIIIGISSVIAIVALGQGSQATIGSEFEKIGTNRVIFRINWNENPKYKDRFSDEDIDSLERIFKDDIKGISPYFNTSGKAIKGRENGSVYLYGVNEQYNMIQSIDLVEGRFLLESDVKGNRSVCIIDEKLANKLFKRTDVIGERIMADTGFSKSSLTVIGVYATPAGTFDKLNAQFNGDTTTMYMPVSAMKSMGMGSNYYSFEVNMMDNEKIDEIGKEMIKVLERRHNVIGKDLYMYYSAQQQMEMMNNILGVLSKVIGAIAAISLVVGGIGVMNIMLVSVTERTREIGIRKAIGATRKDILVQFLVEAMIISATGGAIGTLLGIAIQSIIAMAIGVPPTISVATILIAVLFSAGVGIFFGIYPANKAAKLDPIDALRYE